MRTVNLLIITLLPSLLWCASIDWVTKLRLYDALLNGNFVSKSLSDGSVHFFWQEINGSPNVDLMYQVLFSNGILSRKRVLCSNTNSIHYSEISVQISDDKQHFVLAYDAQRVGATKHTEVYFLESLNGGQDWSAPVTINRPDKADDQARAWPSVLLEEDTGRVYIAYGIGDIEMKTTSLAMTIRQPGKQTFDAEFLIPGERDVEALYLGYTVDKSKSQRYIHLFWNEYTAHILHYTRSTDDGKTWSDDKELIRDSKKEVISAIVDTKVMEGGLFAQYAQGEEVKYIWSKNHGKSWEQHVHVGNTKKNIDSISICGNDGQGILVTSNMKQSHETGYFRYANLGTTSFSDLAYPFDYLKASNLPTTHVSCAVMGVEGYSITYMVSDESNQSVNLAHGILKGT